MRLYATPGSGNCFKPQLVCRQLGLSYETITIDVLKGETKSAAYRSINPLGTVPFLVLEDGMTIAESNAMIWYLAAGTHLYPKTAFEEAQAIQFMLFEQTKLEPFISPARFFTTIVPDMADQKADAIADWQSKARPGLHMLNTHLTHTDFMTGGDYSVGDIAVFGYTHLIDEAGLPLSDYPAIEKWVSRVVSKDDYAPIMTFAQAA
ncbi:MAG: glutathione S-transferase family protein [Pseudomonadota bacterium]